MKELRNKVIYQVFPRQYSSTHDFNGVIKDLDRIKDLNVDYVYLLPIHPIGEVARKGSVGSPYSIKDYRSINKDYGSASDFMKLVNECHKRGMKVIMDIVFNHTSRDNILTEIHPEWYILDDEGNFKNRVGDWSDITDFNFELEETYAYLINTLKMYINMGVDGFRCDVAPMIPFDFWKIAISICRDLTNDIIFIGESVDAAFIKYLRDEGYEVSSDGELFNLFDALYDYDIYKYLEDYFKGKGSLNRYLEEVLLQEGRFRSDYCKMRYLDNHDFGSAYDLVKDKNKVMNALGMLSFFKGMFFIYNGLECLVDHKLDLFEIDEINWNELDEDIVSLLKKLTNFKKKDIFIDGKFNVDFINENAATLSLTNKEEKYYGVFNFDYSKDINVNLKDGEYLDILSNELVVVKDFIVKCSDKPLILKLEF